jgi:prevent-host-death family protein
MVEVGAGEAKAYLHRLLQRVAAGEEVVITYGGLPVARLVPMNDEGEGDAGPLDDVLEARAPLTRDLLDAFQE